MVPNLKELSAKERERGASTQITIMYGEKK